MKAPDAFAQREELRRQRRRAENSLSGCSARINELERERNKAARAVDEARVGVVRLRPEDVDGPTPDECQKRVGKIDATIAQVRAQTDAAGEALRRIEYELQLLHGRHLDVFAQGAEALSDTADELFIALREDVEALREALLVAASEWQPLRGPLAERATQEDTELGLYRDQRDVQKEAAMPAVPNAVTLMLQTIDLVQRGVPVTRPRLHVAPVEVEVIEG